MFKSANKTIRRLTAAAFAAVCVAVMMLLSVGCQDSSVGAKVEMNAQLTSLSGEAWKMVCAGNGNVCDPASAKAIVFDRLNNAVVYNVTGTSWSRQSRVEWKMDGNILYITYGTINEGCVDRYSFVISDDLLTLKQEFSSCNYSQQQENSLTLRKAIAGYGRTPIPNYPVTFAANPAAGGTVSVTSASVPIASGTQVPPGTVLTISATPNAGFVQPATVTVNGTQLANNATYTVTDAIGITADFVPLTYPVTFAANPTGGTVSVTSASGPIASGTPVPHGTVLTITATPANTNYILSQLTVNTVPVPPAASGATTTTHTVTNNKVEIFAIFCDITAVDHPVTFNADIGGTVSVTSADGPITNGQLVPLGTVLTISAPPNNGNYSLSELTVNGETFTNGGTTTVQCGGVMIDAKFASPVTFPTNPTGGSLSVTLANGEPITNGKKVLMGTELTITVSENPGYAMSYLTVNNVAFSNFGKHTVSGPVDIAVSFVTTGIPDARESITSIQNPTPQTQAEQERYDEYLRLKESGADVQFSNTWLLKDETGETHIDYNGREYAASGVFAENDEFWIVGIPLDPYGNVDYSIPAKYVSVGKYTSVGGKATIDITAAKLSSSGKKYSGVPDRNGSDLSIERTNDSGKTSTSYFDELRCMVLEYDPDFVTAVADLDPGTLGF